MATAPPPSVRGFQLPPFEDFSVFVVALLIVAGAFYGLLFATPHDSHDAIYGALLGSVATWAFQRNATRSAHNATIDAQNNGLQTLTASVRRIEDDRRPTAEERRERDADHSGGRKR